MESKPESSFTSGKRLRKGAFELAQEPNEYTFLREKQKQVVTARRISVPQNEPDKTPFVVFDSSTKEPVTLSDEETVATYTNLGINPPPHLALKVESHRQNDSKRKTSQPNVRK